MDEQSIEQLRQMLAAHANVVRCNAALFKMRVANDDARAQGKDDPYGYDAFEDIEKELASYAEQLAD